MKILVLATGGTIGSGATQNGLAPKAGNELKLIKLYQKCHPENTTEFYAKALCNILSENADDSFYETLFNFFKTADFTPFDGIILLHGTDTLSFTASLFAMALRDFNKTVCFVSSNHILEDNHANGIANFHAAVRYIESGYHGFVVPYENHNGKLFYHLATRIMQADAFLDDFHSVGEMPLGELYNNEVILNEKGSLPTQKELSVPKGSILPHQEVGFSEQVLFFRLYPNFPFHAISLENETAKAILFSAYHSGTAPQKELKAFTKRANEKGIDVYLSPLKRNTAQYESTLALLKANIQPLYAMSDEAALAKLKLAYHQKELTIEKFLNKNIYFEEI